MLDYARQRALQVLCKPRRAVLVTNGPGGIQAGEYPCEALNLVVYLLVPLTSDQLFNLEQDSQAVLLTPIWEARGAARIVVTDECGPTPVLLQEPEAQWCALVRVDPRRVQVLRPGGWGCLETLDLAPGPLVRGRNCE